MKAKGLFMCREKGVAAAGGSVLRSPRVKEASWGCTPAHGPSCLPTRDSSRGGLSLTGLLVPQAFYQQTVGCFEEMLQALFLENPQPSELKHMMEVGRRKSWRLKGGSLKGGAEPLRSIPGMGVGRFLQGSLGLH